MKPFDLDKALTGEPVITRKGEKINDIHYFKNATQTEHPVVVERAGFLQSYDVNGKMYNNSREDEDDLFMESKMVEHWTNIYRGTDGCIITRGDYRTELNAIYGLHGIENTDYNQPMTYIKTIKILDEEI